MSRWAISDGRSFREIREDSSRARFCTAKSVGDSRGQHFKPVALVALRKLPDRLHQDSCVSSELNVRLMKQSVERRDRMSRRPTRQMLRGSRSQSRKTGFLTAWRWENFSGLSTICRKRCPGTGEPAVSFSVSEQPRSKQRQSCDKFPIVFPEMIGVFVNPCRQIAQS